jgi:hypothetical protein
LYIYMVVDIVKVYECIYLNRGQVSFLDTLDTFEVSKKLLQYLIEPIRHMFQDKELV